MKFRAPLVAAMLMTFAGLAHATPIVVAPIPAVVVSRNATPTSISLASRFSDPGVSVVRFTFAPTSVASVVFAPVDLALFDVAKPTTVTNFRAYMNSGRYTNTVIHRSSWYPAGTTATQPFVIQGGGYTRPNTTNGAPTTITKFAPIVNEPGITNVRGTIAMAKIGGQPNSATSEWFFNLNDRNATAANGAMLDTQNGGFTVFGRVLGNGLATLDQIANLQRFDTSTFYSNSALNELPLVNPTLSPAPSIVKESFVTIQSITDLAGQQTLTFSATSDNTLVVPTATGTTLQLAYAANRSGTALITVTAKSADNTTVTNTFSVTVRCNPADIADDQGTPLPTNAPNNGVNEGDYNCFFNNFFVNRAVGSPADIADDQGNPRLPATPGVPNNGVNEGDYNLFFNRFFLGCA